MEQLLAQIGSRIDSIAKKLTRDKALQADLKQEMWLSLWEQWQKTPNQTLSWYMQHCSFRAIDYLRKGQSIDSKRREGLERLARQIEQLDSSREPLPLLVQDDCADVTIYRDLFRNIMRRFTDKQRKIMIGLLRGYTERDIGAMEGVSQQAIHSQRKRMQQIAQGVIDAV
jgi:RNA polymerase sigma factor (sigma-70 family)